VSQGAGTDECKTKAEACRYGVESRQAWLIALAALAITTVSYASPLVAAVALKPIAADFGGLRSIPALASSLVWLGSGAGAIPLAWVAERIGVQLVVAFGGAMIATGFLLSAVGGVWTLLVAHLLFIGILGTGGIHALLLTYISRWFDQRRGTALALISSGQYIGGAFWPLVLTYVINAFSWRYAMAMFAVVVVLSIVPLALFSFSPAPEAIATGFGTRGETMSFGRRPRTVFAWLSFAAFLCCVPMSMPPAHLIAFCGDLGITPERGAFMLSVLLGSAFVSRQFWGWMSDRIGGLPTVLAASACQAAAILGFLLTQNEAGLFAVSAAFGLGFSGIIPAYIVAIRELFLPSEASWRISILYFCSILGMAVGGWMAGAIYDHVGYYAPAFLVAIAFNAANLMVIGSLVYQQVAVQEPTTTKS
jgi:MFS family permease